MAAWAYFAAARHVQSYHVIKLALNPPTQMARLIPPNHQSQIRCAIATTLWLLFNVTSHHHMATSIAQRTIIWLLPVPSHTSPSSSAALTTERNIQHYYMKSTINHKHTSCMHSCVQPALEKQIIYNSSLSSTIYLWNVVVSIGLTS